MARAQPCHRLGLVALLGGGHLGGPVRVILVLEYQRDRAPDRHPATYAADDPSDVGLDLLTSPAPVSALTAGEIATQVVLGDLESRGNSIDDDGQLRAVRFARGQQSQH